ncbi:inhibitor of nuclear factor kappa-B kinase-interacting protein isoform X2 [Trichomycterus rosablanca]|uniref:inhibitor of nuclear factor kappa-B kinase-interacting protein isoform X2 n=1 Tax=Trichomycterus rosablanca TaxID=2290929 RepID=UPI002F35A5CC
MPGDGVKQRKTKTAAAVQNNGENRDSHQTCNSSVRKDEEKVPNNNNNVTCGKSSAWAVDVKTGVSLLSLTGCFLLAWVVFQQNAKFYEVEEKYNHLYEKAADLLALQKKFSAISEKCENVQMLENQELQSPLSQLNSLEHKVTELKEWSSGLTERRQKLHEKLASLKQAVERIENRTTAISSDVNAKVTSVRTDVRRMGGLEGDVETLLTQTGDLEKKIIQAEKLMAKRIGDLLAASIDRVSGLRSSSEKNTQGLEQIRKRLPELYAADKKLSESILALESGRAKLVRTLTFASDLRPKMSTIKMDFAMLEPQLVELTLRIGRLAEDVMKREDDIAQIKDSLAKFTDAQKDLKQVQQEVVLETTTENMYEADLDKTATHTEL